MNKHTRVNEMLTNNPNIAVDRLLPQLEIRTYSRLYRLAGVPLSDHLELNVAIPIMWKLEDDLDLLSPG